MIYSTGVARTTVNDKIVHDSSWDLKSMDDNEFEVKLNMNGKRYEIRDFTLDDLGELLQHPHTTDDLGKEGLLTIPLDETTRIKPYPKYSYRLSRSNKRRSPKKKKVSSLRRSKSSNSSSRSSSKSSSASSSKSSKSSSSSRMSSTLKRSLKKKKSAKSTAKSSVKLSPKASVSKKTIY